MPTCNVLIYLTIFDLTYLEFGQGTSLNDAVVSARYVGEWQKAKQSGKLPNNSSQEISDGLQPT